MNIAQYRTENERHEFISAKDVGKSGATVKILGVQPVSTPKFKGLFLTVKLGANKFAYGLSFEGFDLGAVADQCKTTETDDWIGQSLKLVVKAVKKGNKTMQYVNVAPVARSKKKK